MKKTRYLVVLFVILLISGCDEPEDQEKQDELQKQESELANELARTKQEQQTIDSQKEATKVCPESCNDQNPCTEDSCSEKTNFECQNTMIENCCGNDVCEKGEEGCPDCPKCEADDCETAELVNGECVKTDIVPCADNTVCELSEECGLDLSGYPGFLSKDLIIAVGDNAKGSDIFAATTIGNALLLEGYRTETLTVSKITAKKDMIVLGRPCENSLWKHLRETECDFIQTDGIIKAVEIDGQKMVFLSGSTPENTQKLADVLAHPETYSLKGKEMHANLASSSILLS